MVLEQFTHGGRAEAANIDLNAKLFEGGYPSFPRSGDGDRGKGGNDKQPSPGDYQVRHDDAKARTDQKIKDSFGADVFEHLQDEKWLGKNQKKLKEVFEKADKKDVWEMAWRMHELSKVDGKPALIYLSKTEGQPAGNLREKKYEIYLRGSWFGDDRIGQVYH